MTDRDDTNKALAAERAAEDAEDVAQNAALKKAQDDLATAKADDAADDAKIAELEAEVERLKETKPTPEPEPIAKRKTLFGANFGGYKDKGEKQAQAVPRIKQGFGGTDVARWWYSKAPSAAVWDQIPALFDGMSLLIELDGDTAAVAGGAWDAGMRAFCQAAPKDKRHGWCYKHEQDNNKATAAQFTPAADRLAKIHAQYSPPTLRSAPSLPMGMAFNPTSPYWRTYLPKDLTGWDCLGMDAYQQGKGDANAWTAKRVVGQAFDGARELGLGLMIGELGARRTNQYPDGISDDARAKFLTDFLTQYADNANYRQKDGNPILEMVCYFESSDGAAEKVPWMLLPFSDGSGVKSPKAAAVWRAACSR